MNIIYDLAYNREEKNTLILTLEEKGKRQRLTSHSKQWPYPRHIILTLRTFSPADVPSRRSQLSGAVLSTIAAGRRQGCTNSLSSKASLCWDTFLFLISLLSFFWPYFFVGRFISTILSLSAFSLFWWSFFSLICSIFPSTTYLFSHTMWRTHSWLDESRDSRELGC